MMNLDPRRLLALFWHTSLCFHATFAYSHTIRVLPVRGRALYASRGAEDGVGRVFIFGLGYTGLDLAKQLAHRGWQVSGTVSSQEKARRVAQSASSLQVFAFDATLGPLGDPKVRFCLVKIHTNTFSFIIHHYEGEAGKLQGLRC